MHTRRLLIVFGLFACGEADKGDEGSATTAGESSAAASSGGDAADSSGPGPATTAVTSGGAEASAGDSTGAPTTGAADDSSGGPGESSVGGESSDTGAPACPDAPLGPGDHTLMIEHDGVMRSAILHVPDSVDPATPTPLVFNFHGFTSNAAQQVLFSGMNPLADSEGFYVVYPDGLNSSWNAGACCGTSMSMMVDDVGFVRALHAHLATQVCYDPARVYSTGMSNGGFMSNRLACEAADIFAAVAPVSAVNGMDTCNPSRPIPVMAFNGTADLLVSYDGLLYIGVAESFAGWADRDGCDGDPAPGKMNGAASCETYATCADGVQVTQCTFEGMGHCWPGNPICPFGAASVDLDANREMWAFFQQFTL